MHFHLLDSFTCRQGKRRNAGCCLFFSADVRDPPTSRGVCRETVDSAPAFTVRTSKVINLRLPEVEAVIEWSSRDMFCPRIQRLQPECPKTISNCFISLGPKFTLQRLDKFGRF